MLVLGTKVIDQKQVTSGGTVAVLEPLLKEHAIQSTGRAYVRSIIEAQSRHVYANKWSLVTSLRMRDYMAGAAKAVYQKVSFASGGWTTCRLNKTYWTRSDPTSSFEARSARSSRAVLAAMADKKANALECERLVHLAALYALRQAAGEKWFDGLVARALTDERLQIPINRGLLQVEDLAFTPEPGVGGYAGDLAFRPGDIVAFACNMPEALGTIWRVENAVCVGWEESGGHLKLDEPIFAGGGLDDSYTEAELKQEVFQNVKEIFKDKLKKEMAREGQVVTEATLQVQVDKYLEAKYGKGAELKARLSVKALDSRRKQNPYIQLLPIATRIKVLGGRADLP